MLVQYARSPRSLAIMTTILIVAAWLMTGPARAIEGETFGITEINFDAGTIEITNHGDTQVDPNGLVVCNFPSYAPVAGAPLLGPGESTRVDINAIAIPADPSDGEMGLYLNSEFENSDSIVAYVEWGSTGHTRSPVAQAATVGGEAVWTGGFVDAGGQPAITATADFPNSATLWQAGAGEALPFTGPTGSSFALIGLALLLAGTALLAFARTRARAQTVSRIRLLP